MKTDYDSKTKYVLEYFSYKMRSLLGIVFLFSFVMTIMPTVLVYAVYKKFGWFAVVLTIVIVILMFCFITFRETRLFFQLKKLKKLISAGNHHCFMSWNEYHSAVTPEYWPGANDMSKKSKIVCHLSYYNDSVILSKKTTVREQFGLLTAIKGDNMFNISSVDDFILNDDVIVIFEDPTSAISFKLSK